MKKLIGIILVLVMLCAFSISVFAGDTPEAVLKEDDSLLFIAVAEGYKQNRNEEPKYVDYSLIRVKVVERIKGNVSVGEVIECRAFVNDGEKLKKGGYYLCYCKEDKTSLGMMTIEEKHGDQIRLLGYEEWGSSSMLGRFQKYINDGSYAKAEAERVAKLSDEEIAALGENSIAEIEKKPDFNYGFLISVAAAVIISGVAVVTALKKKRNEIQ